MAAFNVKVVAVLYKIRFDTVQLTNKHYNDDMVNYNNEYMIISRVFSALCFKRIWLNNLKAGSDRTG